MKPTNDSTAAASGAVDSAASFNRRDFLLTAAAMAALPNLSACAQPSSNVLRVAVIGHTGKGNYGHSMDTLWLALPETQVVGFADANEAGHEKEKAKLPGVPAFTDYRKMLAELKPDIVSVATRHIGEHRDMILAAAEAGVKGIYCEKPLCRTPAEADEIVEACKKSGTLLSVAHRNRFHPTLPVVIDAVKSGLIGDLLEIRCRGKEDQRGGCLDLWVLGSHDLDLCLAIAGKPISCSAVIQQGDRPATKADIVEGAEAVGPILGDRVHARYLMENGVPVYFDSIKGKGVPKAGFGIQLIGNKGLVDFRIDVDPIAHFVPGNPFQPTKEARPWTPITSAGVGEPEPLTKIGKDVAGHITAARDLISAISEKRDPLCNDKTCRTVVEMIHGVFASHVNNSANVALPLTQREHGLSPWLT